MFEYSDEYLDQLLKGIYEGSIDPLNLPENLYEATAKHLEKGVTEGFGKSLDNIEFGTPDHELLSELRNNIYYFSGAKTFQQTTEMSNALTNEKGELRSFKEFEESAKQVFDKYNKEWLKTEYNTSIIQAGNAAKWNDIEKKKDILPYLRYVSAGDELVCDICDPLNEICLPVDDPFWDQYAPSNHFNCRCLLEQMDKEDGKDSQSEDSDVSAAKEDSKITNEFKYNPGKAQEIFSTEGKSQHPYFQVPREYAEFAKENFGLPLPENTNPHSSESIKEAEKFAQEILRAKYVNYSKFDVSIANDLNESIFRTRQVMPDLQINGFGNAQAANRAIKEDVLIGYKKTGWYKKMVERFGQDSADRQAVRFANAQVSRVENGTVAWSTVRTTIQIPGGETLDISKYRGIFVNEKLAAKKGVIDSIAEKDMTSGWLTKSSGDARAIMHHEIGHEIDRLIGFKNNEQFKNIFNREHSAGIETLSKRLSRYGATAGKVIRHRPDEMIAEAWTEYVTSKNPRELSKEIGDLMLKTYHSKFVKEAGDQTFDSWKKAALKTLRE